MQIITRIVDESKFYVKCPFWMDPIGITVHNTANSVSAQEEIKFMQRNDDECSFHFCVDENVAIQALPLDRNGWHAGDGNGTGNRKTIGIEIARSLSEDESLFDRAEENAAELIAYLLKLYGWDISNIYKHQDWDGKYCPHKTLDRGWERFLNMVKAYMHKPNPKWNIGDKVRVLCALRYGHTDCANPDSMFDNVRSVYTVTDVDGDKITIGYNESSHYVDVNDYNIARADDYSYYDGLGLPRPEYKVGDRVCVLCAIKFGHTNPALSDSMFENIRPLYDVMAVEGGKITIGYGGAEYVDINDYNLAVEGDFSYFDANDIPHPY